MIDRVLPVPDPKCNPSRAFAGEPPVPFGPLPASDKIRMPSHTRFQPSSHARARYITALFGLVGVGLLAGCAAHHASPRLAGDPSVLGAIGDHDDLDAAVETGALQNELAIVHAGPASGGGRRYELIDAQGRPGEMIITRTGDDAFTLRSRLGRFGRPDDEDRLNRAVAKRLRQLYGVEAAPL